jgi:hypothetical protein
MASARWHRELGPLALLLAAAAAQYGWNAWAVTPLVDYDAGGHAGYMLSILETGALPHPLSGWSTFHPPLYHLVGAGVWLALEPLGPRAVVAGLRGISALAMLTTGVATFVLVRRLGSRARAAWVATALVLFVPSNQFAASMIGNEALGAGFAALALVWIVELQRDPYHRGAALAAGLFVGLALATKYTGVFVAMAAVVPFARSDVDRRMLGTFALSVLTAGIVAAPVYARNAVLTGSPVPMTRHLDPMRRVEASFSQGERSVGDYLTVPLACLQRPSVYAIDGEPMVGKWNPALKRVWCAAYASWWWDAFAVRLPFYFHSVDPQIVREKLANHRGKPPLLEHAITFPIGRTLAWLGLLPTALLGLGFVRSLAEFLQSRGRSSDAPIVAMAVVGLSVFVSFTWRAPSTVAAKGSYLLPLAAPAGVFFARGASALGRRSRRMVLGFCGLVALLAAAIFCDGLVLPRRLDSDPRSGWRAIGSELPGSYIAQATTILSPTDRPAR